MSAPVSTRERTFRTFEEKEVTTNGREEHGGLSVSEMLLVPPELIAATSTPALSFP